MTATLRAVLERAIAGREALRELPALILAARGDRMIGHRHAALLQEWLPRAEVSWLDAPHLILQARPDEAAGSRRRS